MLYFIKQKNKNLFKEKNSGFTLIELLVAIGIFTIVLTMVLGAITTIIDANKKARTISTITNDFYFAIETMTRDIKTGVDPTVLRGTGNSLECQPFTSNANMRLLRFWRIVNSEDDFTRERIEYCVIDGKLHRNIENGKWEQITASNVFIESVNFQVDGGTSNGINWNQPFTKIQIKGYFVLSDNTRSDFNIQTAVSQRKLNVLGNER